MSSATAISKTIQSAGIVKEDGLERPEFISSGSLALDLHLGVAFQDDN